ncbi:unnamed protein product [Caenorhabditis brenneri]
MSRMRWSVGKKLIDRIPQEGPLESSGVLMQPRSIGPAPLSAAAANVAHLSRLHPLSLSTSADPLSLVSRPRRYLSERSPHPSSRPMELDSSPSVTNIMDDVAPQGQVHPTTAAYLKHWLSDASTPSRREISDQGQSAIFTYNNAFNPNGAPQRRLQGFGA